jgi:hypothetical protein
MRSRYFVVCVLLITICAVLASASFAYEDEDTSRQVLKQGLVGAGTGALAAGMTGGKAGQGALIGAGTSIIGSALLDSLTGPSRSSSSYRRSAPPPQDDYYYTDDQEYYYEEPPQESSSQKILKQGLVGAGTGALAAGMSGGKAGQGALIGAGTAVVGNALLDTLTQPAEQRRGRVYRRVQPPQQQRTYSQQQDETTPEGTHKKIIRKYDENGKVVSEEEIYY